MTTMALGMIVVALWSETQGSAALRTCVDKATSQSELTICAGEELKRVQRRLDQTYQQLLSSVEKDPDTAPVALKKIKAAQAAWLAYRDAYIEAMYPLENKQREYGSMYPMEVASVLADLTQRQIAAVQDLLEHYTAK
jgi:uncharacterized protein YecT (DUF1311 family)